MRQRLLYAAPLLFLLLPPPNRRAQAADDFKASGQTIIKETAALIAGCENRFEGSVGNLRMSERVERIFSRAGVPHGSTAYEAPVFVPGKAFIEVGGRRMRMYTMLPNVVDPCNFPRRRFSGRLIYVGKGTLRELEGRNLRGALCILDFDCGYNYLRLMPRGAIGCVFIEPRRYVPALAYQKVISIPFTVPRYQVSRVDGEFLKRAAAQGLRYRAQVEPNRWRRQTLRNHWALVEGVDPGLKRQTVIVYANLDAMHYCPELASGATEALNLKLLLDLFEHYRRHPAGRSLLFQVFNSRHQCNLGASEAVYHLFGREEDIFNVDPARPSEERSLWRVKAESEYLLKYYPQLAPAAITADTIAEFRSRQDKPAGQTFPLADPLVRRIELFLYSISRKRLRLLREGKLTPARARELKQLERRHSDIVSMFNKFGAHKVYDYALIGSEDLVDSGRAVALSLADAHRHEGKPAGRVWALLGGEARAALTAIADGEDAQPRLAAVVAGLNRLLHHRDLYRPGWLREQRLSARARDLLQLHRQGHLPAADLTQLNRRLLEAAMPGCLRPVDRLERDFQKQVRRMLAADRKRLAKEQRRSSAARETTGTEASASPTPPAPVLTEAEAWRRVRAQVELTPEQRRIFEQYRLQVMEAAKADLQRADLLLARLATVGKARAKLRPFHPLLALGINIDYDNDWVLGSHQLRSGYGHFGDASHRLYRNTRVYAYDLLNSLAAFATNKCSDLGVRWPMDLSTGHAFIDIPPAVTCHYVMNRVPALTFFTPFSNHRHLLSSGDRLTGMRPERVARKHRFMRRIIAKIIGLTRTKDLLAGDGARSPIKRRVAGAAEFETRINDGTSLTRPQTVLANAMVVQPLHRYGSDYRAFMIAIQGGVIGHRLALSDAGGRAFLYDGGKAVKFAMEVYHLDASGRIDHATDMGIAKLKNDPVWEPLDGFTEHQLLAAVPCRKADLYGVLNPKTLEPVGRPIMQKTGGGTLEKYSLAGFEPVPFGMGCVMLEPDSVVKILFSGSVNLVGSDSEHWDGAGYTIRQLDRAYVPLLAARDAVSLNSHRIQLLTANAVTNNLMANLQGKATNWLRGASSSPARAQLEEQGRQKELFAQVMRGYGAAFNAYPVVNATISDMMKAVIFYLAVLIPFAFLLQRLLFSFVRIEAQIASFLGIFILTYLVFYAIHPAFKIAKNPQIVLIAFTMLTLAGFVALCLKGKFDYHMEDFKARFRGEEEVGVLKLAGTAMLVGVTNMKRRRVRTTLTCITIMLITFTMLSFTSVSQSVSPTRLRKARNASYNGIFFSHQTWRPINPQLETMFTDIVGRGFPVLRRAFIAYDRPASNALLLTSLYEKPIPIQGILGLELLEDGWLGKIPLVGGRYFSSPDAAEILVTDTLAANTLRLPVKDGRFQVPPATWLTLNGVRLKLVGVLDSARMAHMQDLRGCAIVPQQVASTNTIDLNDAKNNVEEEVPEGTFQNVQAAAYVVTPFGLRRQLGIPTVSVAVKFPNPQLVWNRVLEFAHYSDHKVYFGATDRFMINPGHKPDEDAIYELPGRYFLGTGFSTSIGGLGSLIIPLLVSASIILNTMLGAVYERKKEIGIFNAIGLNPIHIALFFVAESVVYGLIGGVGGYLIGQVLAKIVVATHLLPGINLNYSSLSVVYVILFTMLIVIASSLYPALVAMRTASSSAGRRRVEKRGENLLHVQFPFSFTPEMAVAVNSYIREYFAKHCDSSVGDFVATELRTEYRRNEQGNLEACLEYNVALAPYDLGVTQVTTIRTRFNQRVGAFMVEADNKRVSGQDSNWLATNHPFLNGLRKYLLHWRVLTPEGQRVHLDNGLRMFNLSSADLEGVA